VSRLVRLTDGTTGRTEEDIEMVEAYILIQTEAGRASEVARDVATLKGVTMCEYVMGPYEVIARVEAPNADELGRLVIARIQTVQGITRTTTCTIVHM